MPVYAYAGSETRGSGRGITRFLWDEDRGSLTPLGEVTGIEDAIWLVVDAPSRRLYACSASGGRESTVHAYAIDPATGDLTWLNAQAAGGGDCCHASLSQDGRFLMVANYNGAPPPGSPDAAARIFPVTDQGLGPATATLRHTGDGPNAARQERDHAHWILQRPGSDRVLVSDLGIDRLVAYDLGPEGSATPRPEGDLITAPGLGPRHGAFTPDGGRLFVITELIATVLSIECGEGAGAGAAAGGLRLVDSLPVAGPPGGRVQPSGIVMTQDARFLFGALRGVDEVIGLTFDPATGKLAQTGRWPSGGANPRDLTLSPGGRFLLVAHQDGQALTLHGVDPATGTLTGPARTQALHTPMLIKFAVFEDS